jgi:hypothetical protein
MQHFSEQPWADFVRGVSAPEISRDIRAHLTVGCPQCEISLEAWNRVRRLASEEAAYAPAENVVRLSKLSFAGMAAPRRGNWSLANLVFDSFAQPLLAGVRNGALNVWQVIYEAEGLTVDLRFGRRPSAKAVHLVGQVLDKKEVRAWQGVTIEVSTERDEVVGSAAGNASGEFQIEFEAKDHLWLSIKVEGRNTVRIPLTNPRPR